MPPGESYHSNAGSGSKDFGDFAPSGTPKLCNKNPGQAPELGALAAYGIGRTERDSGIHDRGSLSIDKPEYPMKGEGASNGPTSEPGHPHMGGDSKPKASGVGRPEDN
jgi:hypothetical protein